MKSLTAAETLVSPILIERYQVIALDKGSSIFCLMISMSFSILLFRRSTTSDKTRNGKKYNK